MVDMELEELLDAPTKGPDRPVRFAPKGAKFKPKPKPKTEPSQSLTPSASEHVESLSVPKKEDLDVKPDIKPEIMNNAIDTVVDVKPGVKEEERDGLMETVEKEEERDDRMEIEEQEDNRDDSMVTEEEEVEFEDEVVREIDVYFSPSIDPQTQFYLFQYPLRPLWRPYELDDRCEEVRVKPECAEVEIDMAIDVDSKNYDSGADPRVRMKKQTLTSSWKPPQTSGSTVGILTGNKLHLSPIHAVVQLRALMHHLDSKESKRKTVARSNAEVVVKPEEHHEAKSPVTSKNMSKTLKQTKDSGDVWISLKYNSMTSDMTAECLQQMMAQEGSQINFSMSSYDYLQSLCPGTSSNSYSSRGPPRRLLALPLNERFKTWLCEGPQIHRFDALKYLAPDKSLEEVLGALDKYGRLVQGLWVAKSPLVYGKDQGIEVLARDYVLLLFSKNVIIKNSQIPKQPQLSNAMTNVLNVLATKRPDLEDWKLKELPDLNFIKLNPSVVKKQEEEWECLEQKINSLIFGGKKGPGMKTSSKSSTKNNLTASTPSGSTPRIGMSEEVREGTRKAVQKLFKRIKFCSFQQISQRLRDMANSESARSTGFAEEAMAAANSIDAFPDELQAIISQVAINIHGTCVQKLSSDHQFNEFRRVVIDLFIAQGPKAKLKKATILEAAKMELKREIPQNECKKVLQELCSSQGAAWMLKTAD